MLEDCVSAFARTHISLRLSMICAAMQELSAGGDAEFLQLSDTTSSDVYLVDLDKHRQGSTLNFDYMPGRCVRMRARVRVRIRPSGFYLGNSVAPERH
jgi:hypothetical protein